MAERKRALNPKQLRFVEEYMVDHNATQACIRAGYSVPSAGMHGALLLKNASIQAALDEKRKALAERLQISEDIVVNEMLRIGLSDVRNYFHKGRMKGMDELSSNEAAAISSFKVLKRRIIRENGTVEEVHEIAEIKFWDKNTALANLARILGIFKDKSEVDHKGITLAIVER